MTFLAPLYIAGILAVAAPIVFHLIRRAPTGRQAFSSLMFLSPTPPRLTRRSRLTNILLLILRAAALALLALAFARPFFEGGSNSAEAKPRGRRVAVLVDTSASMRAGDAWPQAVAQAEQALAELKPEDEAALYFFDRQVRPGLTFAEWNDLAPAVRIATVKARLAATSPTWADTQIGKSLATVADLLAEEETARPGDAARAGRQLVLISDLQQGGRAEALQGHQWPASVLLQVRAIVPKSKSNAGVQLVEQESKEQQDASAKAASADATARLRVRVTNQAGSAREQFTLTWASDRGPLAGVTPVKVYLPAGRSQIVRVPFPPIGQPGPSADRLVLAGDDVDFDDTLYVVPPRQDVVRVVYLGDDEPTDVAGLRYYLQGALADTPDRRVEFVARKASEPVADADFVGTRVVIVAAQLTEPRATALRRFAENGGDVLVVLRETASGDALSKLSGANGITVTDAAARDFSLLARVELDHPLFSPFADARFGDFTKIHFWKHRKASLPTPPPAGLRVLARFDDGDPFLLEQTVGRGRVFVATSGWNPADSQLALSTKFVPLVDGLVRRRDGSTAGAQQTVYEPIRLPPGDGTMARTLTTPDGRKIDLPAAAAATPEDAADRPGIYKLSANGTETPIAVNLAPDESRTAPMAVEDLERLGAKIGVALTSEELVARQRQLRTAEQENRQKLWRWVILGVLGVLAAETIVAGALARRVPEQEVAL